MIKRTAFIVSLCAGQAQADAALIDLLGPLGCAIGPSTKGIIQEAGFSEADIQDVAAKALLDGNASIEGEWTILADSICTIDFPTVDAPIGWDDPEVQAAIGAIDEYPDDPGCFLRGQELYETLQDTRGWDVDRAIWAYIQLLSEGLARGELRFYGTSPLRTPPSFQVMVGACADVPNADELAESRAIFVENFDAMVRIGAQDTMCKAGVTPGLLDPARLPNPNQTNAWAFMEMTFIAMGGGWFDGISGTQKGTPRPPLCVYP